MSQLDATPYSSQRVTFEANPPIDGYPVVSSRDCPKTAPAHFVIVTSAREFDALAEAWTELFERAGHAHQVFQSWGFAEQFARTHGLWHHEAEPAAADSHSIAIVTAYRAGRLVLVWPLVQHHQLGVRTLSWLGEPISQYGDVLIDPLEEALVLLQQAYSHLIDKIAPDVVRLRKVREDAAVAPFLKSLGVEPIAGVEAPCVTLAAGGSAFEDRQSGKAKKNRRRLMRRLEERGSVTFEEATATPRAREVIDTALAIKRDWLVRRGLVSPALADPRLDAFWHFATEGGGNLAGGSVFALRLNDKPVAIAMGFRAKKRLMLHLITHDAEVEKLGAGVLNLEAILRLAEAEGLEAVDLLPPKADYKLDWADRSVPVGDFVWGTTARGRLLTRGIDGLIKPQAKRALEGLPLSFRQRLVRRSLGSVAGRAGLPRDDE